MQKRALLKAISLTAAGIALSRVPVSAAPEPRVLVAYFSRTGNTRVIANQIRRARSATLFEIKTATPYPEDDYQTTVDQAASETKAGYLPPLMQFVADVQSYDTIFLGFPIWGMTAPTVIRSFLLAYDLAGKTIRNTSGVTYHDEYVRRDGQWLISKRTSNFAWRSRQELAE